MTFLQVGHASGPTGLFLKPPRTNLHIARQRWEATPDEQPTSGCDIQQDFETLISRLRLGWLRQSTSFKFYASSCSAPCSIVCSPCLRFTGRPPPCGAYTIYCLLPAPQLPLPPPPTMASLLFSHDINSATTNLSPVHYPANLKSHPMNDTIWRLEESCPTEGVPGQRITMPEPTYHSGSYSRSLNPSPNDATWPASGTVDSGRECPSPPPPYSERQATDDNLVTPGSRQRLESYFYGQHAAPSTSESLSGPWRTDHSFHTHGHCGPCHGSSPSAPRVGWHPDLGREPMLVTPSTSAPGHRPVRSPPTATPEMRTSFFFRLRFKY
ncbi:hypothetical protein DENSPDRAFT_835351, partial [Dentipellis sp. KUC8613]